MKLNITAFAGATTIVTAVLFALCALLITLAPGSASAFFGFLFHVDLTGITFSMTWGAFLGGLAIWVVGMGVIGMALAWLYNTLTRTHG